MKIIFKTVHIENFLSIGDATVRLNDGGYTVVNGVNKNPDDLAKSNGAGKSTVFEAISWCLTGETIRGSKNVVNLYGTNGALVELAFQIDNDDYKIIRTKEHSKLKNNLKLYINGEDKSGKGIRDTEKLLTEYLPDLTGELLGSVIILGQGLPQRFSNNSPAGRKEVLEKLSKSDFMIEDIKSRVSNRKIALNKILRANEDTILKYNSTEELLNRQINENQIKLESMTSSESLNELISMLEASILDCTVKINSFNDEIEQLRQKHQEVSQEQTKFNQQIADINAERAIISDEKTNIYSQLSDEKTQLNNNWQPIINDTYKKYTETISEINSKTAELTKLKNIEDICPTCGQKLPGVFKPDTTELETAIKQLNVAANELLNTKNQAEQDKDQELQILNSKYADILAGKDRELKDKDLEINQIKIQLDEAITNLNNLTKQAVTAKTNVELFTNKCNGYQDRINNAKLEKENLESNRLAAQNIIDSNLKQIEEINNKIAEETKIKESTERHLEIISKMSTIITRDFRGYLLINIINFINNKAKEYALEVFETDKIDFILDGNNISITYDGKDYSNLSGGEKQKVDIIVQFAIRDMLCKYLNFSSNILVLDEICDNVDSVGAEKLFNLISRKLSDVQDIFIISHHTDFVIPYDRQLMVIKGENKVSKIEEII